MTGPTTVLQDLASLPDRITASAQRVRDLTTELRNAREQRDQLIVDARDEAGMKVRDVARAADLSVPQVIRILATSSED